jgi:integrase
MYSKPKLYHFKYNLNKKWFVGFRYYDNELNAYKQYQLRGDINKFSTKAERIAEGNALKSALSDLLQLGWTPSKGLPESSDDKKISSNKTLIESLKYLIEIRKSHVKPESTRTYIDVQKVFEGWLKSEGLLNIKPDQFTNELARKYLDSRLASGYGASTHNKHLSMLITLFNLLIERKHITENPFKGIKPLRRDIGKNIAFTTTERTALAKKLKAENPQLFLFVQFMYYCFLRRTEILNLKIQDISLASRTILVAYGSGKNRKQEAVSIPKEFLVFLKSLNLEKYPQEFYVFSRNLLPGENKRLKADAITHMHKEFLKALKIDSSKTLYSWKHSGVVELYKEIKDPYALMRQLRHYDLATTMIYLKSLGLSSNTPVLEADISI